MGYLDDFDTKEMIGEMESDVKGRKSATWQPEEGETYVRILPPLKSKGEKKFWFTYNMNWVNRVGFIDTNQELVDKNGNLHSPEENPIQEFAQKLFNASERGSDEWALANSIRSKPRYVLRVVVRGSDDKNKPVFWEIGKQMFQKIHDIIKNSKIGLSIIDPSSKGRDFIVVKKGSGLTTNYDNSQVDVETSPLAKTAEDLKEIFESAEKLDYNSLIEFRSVEEMRGAVRTLTGEEAEEQKRARAPQFESESLATTEENVEEENSVDSAIDDLINEYTDI